MDKPKLVAVDFNPKETAKAEVYAKSQEYVIECFEKLLERAKLGEVRHAVIFSEDEEGASQFSFVGLASDYYRNYYTLSTSLPDHYEMMYILDHDEEEE